MKKREKRLLLLALLFLGAFVLWTLLVRLVDVRPIGPNGSSVGFATLNDCIRTRIGVNMLLYTVTDWLGLVPIFVAFSFAIFGLLQWVRRKSLRRVDGSILALGGFYLAVMGVYLLFEVIAVNYRPVLIGGYLEKSYPSSTTMLVMCVIPSAVMQLNARIRHRALRAGICALAVAFTAFMTVGRFLSGVHWFTDILGGALVSAGLVFLYRFVTCFLCGTHRMPSNGG